MTPIRTVQVTFDCAAPEQLARFWCEVLGYRIPDGADGQETWCAAEDPTGSGPRIFFQQVPEGKVAKNRVHLDVRVGVGLVGAERESTLDVEGARLEALGAVRVRLMVADEENESCLVMGDVEDNEFCLA